MLYDPTDGTTVATTEAEIVREAIERWKDVSEWQGQSDQRAREDIKFSHGDSRNTWQWPDKIYAQRTGGEAELPALTVNKTRVHNDIIINEMSKGGWGLKVRPTGGKASARSAEVMMSLIRRIQNISNYEAQRRRVAEHQVDGGIGYMIIETRYTSNRSKNQEIFLSAPRDPTGVYLDRYIKEPDGSDATFGFVFERMPRKEFQRKYPKYVGKIGKTPLGSDLVTSWLTDREVTLAKYFRKVQKPDRYIWWRAEDGSEIETLESELKAEIKGDETGLELFRELMWQIREGVIDGDTRRVFNDAVEWYLIGGDVIIDKGDWPGRYIPICRCVGREIVVDTELDRKGHTRSLIDAQRMLNYAASCSVEAVAQQTKAQFLVPLRAIEGNEDRWKDSNVKNYVVLPYNDVDDEAAEGLQNISPPIRIDPPRPAPGWLQVGQDAERHMMMASGQYQSQLGQPDQGQTAVSGKAIGQRQEQSDTATYHFVERLAEMDRHIGVQLLDLIPKVYDSKRTMQVLDARGELYWISIEPEQDEALRDMQAVQQEGQAVQLALNPSLGEYECVSDPGPTWATQREEAWDALVMILTQRPELSQVVGDLLFKVADFPGAEELQERVRLEIKATKPYLFGGVDPAIQQLQEQLQAQIATNADLMGQLADEKLKARGRDEKHDIDAYKAQTDRMKATIDALAKMVLTPQQQAQMNHEVAMAGHEHIFNVIEDANRASLDSENSEAA